MVDQKNSGERRMNDMEIQKETTGQSTEKAVSPQQENTNVLDAASQLAERIEKGNADTRALIERQEQLYARQMLSGRSDAGQMAQKPAELTPQEYAKQVLQGKINPLMVI